MLVIMYLWPEVQPEPRQTFKTELLKVVVYSLKLSNDFVKDSILVVWKSSESTSDSEFNFSSRVKVSTRYTELKKIQLYEKLQPGLKIFQLGLKYISLEKIENLMKVKMLNRKHGKNKSQERWL